MLALAIYAALTTPSHPEGTKPKRMSADVIVGIWVQVEQGKAPEDCFTREFHKDGTTTSCRGKSRTKGTYTVTRGQDPDVITVVVITLEQDDKPLPPETAIIAFLDENRMAWYPEGEWRGVRLNRKK